MPPPEMQSAAIGSPGVLAARSTPCSAARTSSRQRGGSGDTSPIPSARGSRKRALFKPQVKKGGNLLARRLRAPRLIHQHQIVAVDQLVVAFVAEEALDVARLRARELGGFGRGIVDEPAPQL